MYIKKGEKEYKIEEFTGYWRVTRIIGSLTVDYQVEKEICEIFEELAAYIEKDEMF